MKLIKWIKSIFKRKQETSPKLARRKERDFDLVELSQQLDRGKTHMIISKGKTYRVRELGILLLMMIFTGCNADINLLELLKSQQWELTYYKIDNGNQSYYATDRQYRIQFRDSNQIAVFTQSGDVAYGQWQTNENKLLDITMNGKYSMHGNWEMIKYETWGYAQDRLIFRQDSIEWGIKPW